MRTRGQRRRILTKQPLGQENDGDEGDEPNGHHNDAPGNNPGHNEAKTAERATDLQVFLRLPRLEAKRAADRPEQPQDDPAEESHEGRHCEEKHQPADKRCHRR